MTDYSQEYTAEYEEIYSNLDTGKQRQVECENKLSPLIGCQMIEVERKCRELTP